MQRLKTTECIDSQTVLNLKVTEYRPKIRYVMLVDRMWCLQHTGPSSWCSITCFLFFFFQPRSVGVSKFPKLNSVPLLCSIWLQSLNRAKSLLVCLNLVTHPIFSIWTLVRPVYSWPSFPSEPTAISLAVTDVPTCRATVPSQTPAVELCTGNPLAVPYQISVAFPASVDTWRALQFHLVGYDFRR